MQLRSVLFAATSVLLGAGLSPASAVASNGGLCCLDAREDVVRSVPAVPAGSGGDAVLDFEGLGNQEPVENFYNGGLGGNGSGPGPNYGVVFGSSSLSIISQEAGGTGNFTNNPSGDTILFFLTGSAVVDVDGGFDTGFSFFYSAASNPGVVRVYDGPGATGTVLAELNLPVTPPTGSTPYTFDNWVPFGVTFSGVARSVDFGGTANQIGFDNITLGSDVPGNPGGPVLPPAAPVPVVGPLALILMTLGVMLLGWVVARR